MGSSLALGEWRELRASRHWVAPTPDRLGLKCSPGLPCDKGCRQSARLWTPAAHAGLPQPDVRPRTGRFVPNRAASDLRPLARLAYWIAARSDEDHLTCESPRPTRSNESASVNQELRATSGRLRIRIGLTQIFDAVMEKIRQSEDPHELSVIADGKGADLPFEQVHRTLRNGLVWADRQRVGAHDF